MAGARIAEIPVRHHPRRQGTSKYGLSRVFKVALDLFTIKMIRSFREQPLLLFGIGAAAASMLGLGFATAAVFGDPAIWSNKANALVLPGTAALWLALACFLLMLGFIAEAALRLIRLESHELGPIAHAD